MFTRSIRLSISDRFVSLELLCYSSWRNRVAISNRDKKIIDETVYYDRLDKQKIESKEKRIPIKKFFVSINKWFILFSSVEKEKRW